MTKSECQPITNRTTAMDEMTKAREIVTEWIGMFDPPPQIDFQQSEILQHGIAAALAAKPTAPVGMPVCPLCKKKPGEKVGPPAMVRCVTDGCEGRNLAAHTVAEWRSYAAPPPSTQKVRELLNRVQRLIERDYPNGQLAIDIRAALSTNPGEQE